MSNTFSILLQGWLMTLITNEGLGIMSGRPHLKSGKHDLMISVIRNHSHKFLLETIYSV